MISFWFRCAGSSSILCWWNCLICLVLINFIMFHYSAVGELSCMRNHTVNFTSYWCDSVLEINIPNDTKVERIHSIAHNSAMQCESLCKLLRFLSNVEIPIRLYLNLDQSCSYDLFWYNLGFYMETIVLIQRIFPSD